MTEGRHKTGAALMRLLRRKGAVLQQHSMALVVYSHQTAARPGPHAQLGAIPRPATKVKLLASEKQDSNMIEVLAILVSTHIVPMHPLKQGLKASCQEA